jgi:hypothetical protein
MLEFILLTLAKAFILFLSAAVIYCIRKINFLYEDDGSRLRCGFEIEIRDLSKKSKPNKTSKHEKSSGN